MIGCRASDVTGKGKGAGHGGRREWDWGLGQGGEGVKGKGEEGREKQGTLYAFNVRRNGVYGSVDAICVAIIFVWNKTLFVSFVYLCSILNLRCKISTISKEGEEWKVKWNLQILSIIFFSFSFLLSFF